MNLLDKLECKLEKGDVFTLLSTYNTGKTTLLCLLAYELLSLGKNVLFITDENNPETIARKFMNIIPNQNELRGSLIVKRKFTDNNLVNYELPKDVDVIIFDGYYGNKENLKEHALKKQIIIMETKLVKRDILNNDVSISDSNKLMQRSDFVLKIERTKIRTKLSFLDKLHNLFCFWSPKIVEKDNLSLQVLKNRRGKKRDFSYLIDFDGINKK